MAKNMHKSAKQLGELLQDQQEPFRLEIYLLERGYLKKGLNSEASIGFCRGNPSKKGVLYYSSIMRAAIKKLISVNKSSRKKRFADRDGEFSITEMQRKSQEVAELDRCSSAGNTTLFNSLSGSEIEEMSASASFRKDQILFTADISQTPEVCSLTETEAATDRKQLSPVSVLEGLPCDEGSPIHNNINETGQHDFSARKEEYNSLAYLFDKTLQYNFTTRQDKNASTSLCELLFHLSEDNPKCNHLEELQEFNEFNLQQRKQLVTDCGEVIGTHERERKQQEPRPENLGKFIYEKIKNWGKFSGDETSITQLLHSDYSASAQDWSNLEPHNREIAAEISDAILEDITCETVTDMVDIFLHKF